MISNLNLSKGLLYFCHYGILKCSKRDYLQSRRSNESELGKYKMNNKQYVAVLEQPFKSLCCFFLVRNFYL